MPVPSHSYLASSRRAFLYFLAPRWTPAATSNSSTRGRVKLLHLTEQQDVVKLACCCSFGSPSRCFLQAPALAFEVEQVAVMHEPVEERGDDDHVAQEPGPVVEWTIGCNDGRRLLVTRHEDVREFVACVGR